MRNLYDVLGVARDADKAQIKKGFKALAKKYHPDVSDAPDAEEHFKEANAAYAVIGDEARRALYDEFGEVSLQQGFDANRARAYRGMGGGGPGMEGGVSLDDLLGNLFGAGAFRGSAFRGFDPSGGFGQHRGARRGQDQRASVSVDLVTALRGGELPITLRGPSGPRRLTVKLPAGVRDGQTMRLKGQGAPPPGGPSAGGRPGDVLLEIRVTPHPSLTREGDDLIMEVPVTFAESMAGGPVRVPTPSGEVVVKIPAGARSGARLRLKGKGAQGPSGRGNLYLVLRPTPPAGAADEGLVEQLAALYEGDIRAKLSF